MDYLQPIVQEKRRQQGTDLISVLVQSEVEGEMLSDLEVVSFLRLLTLAGAETTNHLIGTAFVALLADPTLVKRPVLQAGDRIIVGFSETLYAGVFGTAAAARPARR